MFQAIVWLLPFLLALTVSVACMLRKPKAVEELEDSEMLSGLFDEVITGRDRQREFAERQDAKLKSVLARVDREQEKRLDVQQAIDKTKKDLVYSQDELRSSMNENLRTLESKLVGQMAQRLAKIPIPDKLKAKVLGKEARRGRDRDRERDRERLLEDRPDSAASIYERAQEGRVEGTTRWLTTSRRSGRRSNGGSTNEGAGTRTRSRPGTQGAFEKPKQAIERLMHTETDETRVPSSARSTRRRCVGCVERRDGVSIVSWIVVRLGRAPPRRCPLNPRVRFPPPTACLSCSRPASHCPRSRFRPFAV